MQGFGRLQWLHGQPLEAGIEGPAPGQQIGQRVPVVAAGMVCQRCRWRRAGPAAHRLAARIQPALPVAPQRDVVRLTLRGDDLGQKQAGRLRPARAIVHAGMSPPGQEQERRSGHQERRRLSACRKPAGVP
jgi:hypothetical protein